MYPIPLKEDPVDLLKKFESEYLHGEYPSSHSLYIFGKGLVIQDHVPMLQIAQETTRRLGARETKLLHNNRAFAVFYVKTILVTKTN